MKSPLRKTSILTATVFLVICAGSSPISAQTKPAEIRTFTLEEALNYALQNYPAVRVSLEQIQMARAGVSVAKAQYLPSFTGVFQDSRATQNQVDGIWLPAPINAAVEGPVGNYSGQNYWASQAGGLVSWEPFDFGLRSSVVRQAQAGEEKANSSLVATRLQVAAAVGNYFLSALAAREGSVAAEANVARWQVFNQSVHALVDNDLRPGADASRADAQLALAKTQLYQAQQAEQTSLAMLAALMGTAGTEIQLVAGKLSELPPADPLPSLAPGGHPLAREQLALLRQVQTEEKVLDKTDYPKVYLQAEAFARGSGIPDNGAILGHWNGLMPARGNWVAGITVALPNFFDFKALNAEKQMSKANERSHQALYDKTIQDLTGEARVALAQLKSAQLISKETPIELAAARASENQSRARYDASLATLVEVADAEGLLARAESDDAVARLNVWHSLFGVAYAQGDLQPFLNLLKTPAK